MLKNKIRPISVCVFRNGDSIFVAEGFDNMKNQTFYRPLGGAIEFGEHSKDTITREMKEEISAEVKNLKYLGVVENIFTYQGEQGHEIVFIYDGEFANESFYESKEISFYDEGIPFKAVWKPIKDFLSDDNKTPLYPEGLLGLLTHLTQSDENKFGSSEIFLVNTESPL